MPSQVLFLPISVTNNQILSLERIMASLHNPNDTQEAFGKDRLFVHLPPVQGQVNHHFFIVTLKGDRSFVKFNDQTFTTEVGDVGDGYVLAEINALTFNPQRNLGIYMQYHQSLGATSAIKFLKHKFKEGIEAEIASEIAAGNQIPTNPKEFEMSILIPANNLEDYFATFQEALSISFSVEENRYVRGLAGFNGDQPRTEKVREIIHLAPEANQASIEQRLRNLATWLTNARDNHYKYPSVRVRTDQGDLSITPGNVKSIAETRVFDEVSPSFAFDPQNPGACALIPILDNALANI